MKIEDINDSLIGNTYLTTVGENVTKIEHIVRINYDKKLIYDKDSTNWQFEYFIKCMNADMMKLLTKNEKNI